MTDAHTDGPAAGVAYWVPLSADLDSLPMTSNEGGRAPRCSVEQVAWLNSHASKVMFPQQYVVANHGDESQTISLVATPEGDQPDRVPGFYLQCAQPAPVMDTSGAEDPGALVWRQVRLNVQAEGAIEAGVEVTEELDFFSQTLGPGERLGLQVGLEGLEPFAGSIQITTQPGSEGAATTHLSAPVLEGDVPTERFFWPGIDGDRTPLVFPFWNDVEEVAELRCNDDPTQNAVNYLGRVCTPSLIYGIVASRLEQPDIAEQYLTERLGRSTCDASSLDADRELVADVWSGLYLRTTAITRQRELPAAVTRPAALLGNRCTDQYLSAVLDDGDAMMADIRSQLLPPHTASAAPDWARCESGGIPVKAARWAADETADTSAGTVTVCDNQTVTVRIADGPTWTAQTLTDDGNWVDASDDANFVSMDASLTQVTIGPNNGGSVRSYDVCERWLGDEE